MAVVHALEDAELAAICADLAELGLPVGAAQDVDHVVHIYPHRDFTVLEEITALRPFVLATDAPKQWHGAKP